MTELHDSQQWVKLGPRQYRLSHLYTIPPTEFASIVSKSQVLAVSREGGPIALVPNRGYGIEAPLKVFTASGKQLCGESESGQGRQTFPGAKVVNIGWIEEVFGDDTVREEGVACVHEDGAVRIWNARGVLKKEIAIRLITGDRREPGSKQKNYNDAQKVPNELLCYVQKSQVLSDGSIITLTSDAKLLFTSIDGETKLLHTLTSSLVGSPRISGSSDQVDAEEGLLKLMCLDPRIHNVSTPESIICQGHKGFVTVVNSREAITYAQPEAYTFSELSPCGEKIALYMPLSNHIRVLSSRNCDKLFTLYIPENLTHNRAEPIGISWIASECVVAIYPPSIVLLDVTGDRITGEFRNCISRSETSTILSADTYALRVANARKLYMIDEVSQPLSIAVQQETSAAYKLVKSCSLMDRKGVNPEHTALRRYQTTHSLFANSAMLYKASEICMTAALSCLDTKQQRALLKAAAYGFALNRALTPRFENTSGPTMALVIARTRLENSLRARECGIALNHKGFKRLGEEKLAIRLSSLGAHDDAASFIRYTGIKIGDAAFNAALDVMRNPLILSEKVVANLENIREQFQLGTSFFGRIASVVGKTESLRVGVKKRELITSLLEKEPSPGQRVDALVATGQHTYALIDAYQHGDPSKINSVTEVILESGEFVRVVRSLPKVIGTRVIDVRAAYLKGLKRYEELRKLFIDVGRWREAAGVDIVVACSRAGYNEKLRDLENTRHTLRNRLHRHYVFEYSAIRSAISVLNSARDLEKQENLHPGTLYNSNANQLLSAAVGIDDSKARASLLHRMRYEMKIPDRRYCWVVLKAMGRRKDFEGIRKMASGADNFGRVPVVGFNAFVDVCLEEGQANEAALYAIRIPDLRDRARALARCGKGREAAEVAARLNSQSLMEEVAAIATRSLPVLSVL